MVQRYFYDHEALRHCHRLIHSVSFVGGAIIGCKSRGRRGHY
jgi:hypothetical protein